MREENTILEGRKWFYRGQSCRTWLSLEWYFLWQAKSSPGFFIQANGCDDRGLLLHLCIPFLLSIYVGLDFDWLQRFLPTDTSTYLKEPVELPALRELSVRIHHGAIWWCVWMDPDEWRSDDPRYRRGNWNFVDFLLGKIDYTKTDMGPVHAALRMPEGDYQVTGRKYRAKWKRPRWPWSDKQVSIDINFEPAVPIPGKGTASYNCGDDATFGLCRKLDYSVGHVLNEFRLETIERRMEYGGPRWKPRDGWPVSIVEKS